MVAFEKHRSNRDVSEEQSTPRSLSAFFPFSVFRLENEIQNRTSPSESPGTSCARRLSKKTRLFRWVLYRCLEEEEVPREREEEEKEAPSAVASIAVSRPPPARSRFSSPSIYSQFAVIVDVQLLLAPRRGVRNVELLFGRVNGGRKKREGASRG